MNRTSRNALLGCWMLAALPSAALAQAKASDPGVWRASTGINYSEGDYGDTQKTKVISAPVAVKYSRGGFSIRVALPYVHIEGPGSLLDTPQGRDAGFGGDAAAATDSSASTGSGSTGSGTSGSGSSGSGSSGSGSSGSGSSGSGGSGSGSSGSGSSGSGSSGSSGSGGSGSGRSGGSGGSGAADDSAASGGTTVAAAPVVGTVAPAAQRSGLGDMSVTMAYSFDLGRGFYADLSGRIKIPTASRSRRLGTGKVDFTGGVDLIKDIGRASVYAGGRRKFIGKPAGAVLRDVWGFGTGASYRVSRSVFLGADYDWQQSSTPGNGPSSEITGWANIGLSWTVRMQVYASTGFSTNSADFAGGLSISWRFR